MIKWQTEDTAKIFLKIKVDFFWLCSWSEIISEDTSSAAEKTAVRQVAADIFSAKTAFKGRMPSRRL